MKLEPTSLLGIPIRSLLRDQKFRLCDGQITECDGTLTLKVIELGLELATDFESELIDCVFIDHALNSQAFAPLIQIPGNLSIGMSRHEVLEAIGPPSAEGKTIPQLLESNKTLLERKEDEVILESTLTILGQKNCFVDRWDFEKFSFYVTFSEPQKTVLKVSVSTPFLKENVPH